MQMQRYIGKNPANYKTIRKETSKNLQILTILMILKRLRLKSESNLKKKKKKKRRETAEKNKLLQKRKAKETKIKEKRMCKRLAKLNGEFKDIK